MDATGKPAPSPGSRVEVPTLLGRATIEDCRRDFARGAGDRAAIDAGVRLAASKQRNGRGTN